MQMNGMIFTLMELHTLILFVLENDDNTLGDVDTGSAQFDGGVGIAKKLTVGMKLLLLRI